MNDMTPCDCDICEECDGDGFDKFRGEFDKPCKYCDATGRVRKITLRDKIADAAIRLRMLSKQYQEDNNEEDARRIFNEWFKTDENMRMLCDAAINSIKQETEN